MPLSKHVPARALALAAGLALSVGAGTAAAAPAAGHASGSRVVGHLYVNDNTAGENTIAAYARHADGTLTPVPGSPFPAGGAGTGTGIGSQGALQKADDGRLLIAVDAGSDQVSVLRIERGGALAPVAGGPVASGGNEPVSIAVHAGRVYVANAGTESDYAAFTLTPAGTLTAIPDAVVSLPAGSDPGDVLINNTGTRLVGTRVGTSLIDSFVIGHHGRLQAAANSPSAAQGPGPFGSEFSPTNPDQVFVSNAHGGTDAGTVSAFTDGPGGVLTSIGSGPFPNGQTAPCWVTITRDGQFLFTVNTAVPSVSSYSVAPSGALTLVGNTPFAGSDPGSLGPEDARLTPDESALWVVDTKGDALSGFQVSDGAVTAMPEGPISLPAGAAPFGIVTTS